MSIKISDSLVEAFIPTPDLPIPIPLKTASGFPINPMLFPHDWSIECELETSWLTDVTQSLDQHEDRWILANRPGRTLRARIVGATKGECEAMMQAARSSASQFGFPVPIYPDAAEIDEIVPDGADYRIYGQFSLRRFFRGGRVSFLPIKIDPLQSNEGACFAQIKQVTPEHLLVSLNQGTSRVPIETDVVVPCMDVEMVEEASGTALTDSVATLDLKFTEIDGPSSLPANWPATSVEDPSVLLPLCKVVSGRGVFPFNPNWSEGVQITHRRLVDSDLLGRTNVQEAQGKPFLEFELDVMGYDRPSCWKAARFFDAHRGRGASFWFVHPMAPWSAGDAAPTPIQTAIRGAGNPFELLSAAQEAIIALQDGTTHIRTINGVAEQPEGDFWLSWADPLPNGDIVEIQPVYVCRFDQDSLREVWNTNTVIPALSFKIVEEPQKSKEVSIGFLGYASEYTSYTAVPDCNLLLRAGSNCYALKPQLTRPEQLCSPWPAASNRVRIWRDSSIPYDRDGAPARPQMTFSTATETSALVLPIPSLQMNGQPFILNPFFLGETILDASLPIDDRQLWSPTEGWTVFFVISPYVQTATSQTRLLMELVSPEFTFALGFDTTTLVNPDPAWIQAGPGAGTYRALTRSSSGSQSCAVFTVHLGGSNNANSMRVWLDGKQAIASGATASCPNASAFSAANIFPSFVTIPVSSSGIAAALNAGSPGACLLASYKRALSISEINNIHKIISSTYQIPIQPSTLF